VAFLQIQVD